MLTLLGALTLATLVAPLLIRQLGRNAFLFLALIPFGGFLWICQLFATNTFAGGGALEVHYPWMPSAHLDITLRLDALSGLFSLIILGIGALILLYCRGYFDSNPRRLATFGMHMVGFALAMFGLVISDNLLLMYVFWEITSVLSFLLVGYYGERASSRRAAGQALMITTLGGLAMLVGIILLGRQTGAWELSAIPLIPELATVPRLAVAFVLILAGALSKSAIAPAHFWLPGAMAAPTPVSAYLHSAAMVKAGIYLVARLAPDVHVLPAWHLVVLPLGVFTMLMAGWMALRQRDLKLILAYGTVSQLGFIMSVIGIGSRTALLAGLALTFGHALFKATLFMVVGAIDHTTGTRDIREISGLGRKEPFIMVLAILSAASMAGVPPLLGFVAKETALSTVMDEALLIGMPRELMLAGLVLGSVLTVAYSAHFLYGAFATKAAQEVPCADAEDKNDRVFESLAIAEMQPIRARLWFAPLALSAFTIVLGLFPGILGRLLDMHIDNLAAPADIPSPLALWHGFGLPVILTGVILAGGALMFWQRAVVAKAHFRTAAFGNADHAYDKVLAIFRLISLRLTASTQRGSLGINLAIIFAVVVLLPLSALISGARSTVRMQLWDTPMQAVAAAIIIVMAVAATRLNNRLSALIVVGVTGYALAVLFALQGAPDLALTQTLVETMVMVVFMLVLRKLPTETHWRPSASVDRMRAWLAVAVGFSVVVVALFAMNARSSAPISVFIPDLAKDISHGANAVNVLLVDQRAWDTFGEIMVLVIAATGVASLVFRSRSFTRRSRRPTLRSEGRRWLAADVTSERARSRSLMVDVATRLLFPTMVAVSFYFFFSGHNAPGGGFAGGLVAALAITLRYLAGGRAELEETLPVDPARMMGTGVLAAAAAVIWPMFLGRPPLTTQVWEWSIPVIGDVHIPSALLFDAGVYLIVVGVALHILHALGGKIDADEALRRQRARDRARSMKRARELRKQQEAAEAEQKAGKAGAGAEKPRASASKATEGGKIS